MKKTALLCLFVLLIGMAGGLLLNLSFLNGRGLLERKAAYPNETEPKTSTPPENAQKSGGTVPEQENFPLLQAGQRVLTALESGDIQALSTLVDPQRGVSFTPYSTVDNQSDLTFLPDQLIGAASSGTKYIWGTTHGKGEPIELTLPEYLKSYVYNAQYVQAPMIGVDHVISAGNSLENVADAYPGCRFVEYYFPELVPSYGGMDWCALKLVFSHGDGGWQLVGIIHSEWTI